MRDSLADLAAALDAYAHLLRERGIPLGLISEADADRVRTRHVEDSVRAAHLLSAADAALCDIGSGAGLPAIPIAIARPDVEVTAIEPRTKAVGFLELAVDRLGLANVRVLPVRVEEVDLRADVATARAFAPLERSWDAAVRLLRPGGRLIYFAGRGLADPVALARSIEAPEPPASVTADPVIADFSPLVIMARAGDGALGDGDGGQASTTG